MANFRTSQDSFRARRQEISIRIQLTHAHIKYSFELSRIVFFTIQVLGIFNLKNDHTLWQRLYPFLNKCRKERHWLSWATGIILLRGFYLIIVLSFKGSRLQV